MEIIPNHLDCCQCLYPQMLIETSIPNDSNLSHLLSFLSFLGFSAMTLTIYKNTKL